VLNLSECIFFTLSFYCLGAMEMATSCGYGDLVLDIFLFLLIN
jgi:hypothetical protein